MSYVVASADLLAIAAQELADLGSDVRTASAAAAASTTSLLAAASDEVSTGIAALFAEHGLEYQAVSARVAQFQERFVGKVVATANAYLSTEIANAGPLAAAGTRITIPGSGPLYFPRFITNLPYIGQLYMPDVIPFGLSALQGYDFLNHVIGRNWFPDTVAQVVNFPASIGILSGSLRAPGANEAAAIGQAMLNDQIMTAVANANGSPVHIAALSQGTIVLNRELAYLATAPNAPPPDALQFAMFGSPELGLARIYVPAGATVPLIDYTAQALANTQYDVSVVFGQYDGWADPPDRPWNLLSLVNSLFGIAYQHNTPALASMSNAVILSSETASLGGTITTYMIPAPILPMLMPLLDIGVPQPIVTGLNSFLQPIVNAGYSSLDPGAGPYFSGGALVGIF